MIDLGWPEVRTARPGSPSARSASSASGSTSRTPSSRSGVAPAGEPPELLTNTDGIQFEKVAALRPDLKRSDDEKLSQIAPVVATPEGYADFGIPWQETTRTVGRIVGEPDEAEKLVGDLEARIAEAKDGIRSSRA